MSKSEMRAMIETICAENQLRITKIPTGKRMLTPAGSPLPPRKTDEANIAA